MSQVRTGTVTVTNGSAIVTGVGTQFVSEGVVAGNGFFIDARRDVVIPVQSVDSETQLTLSANWAVDTAPVGSTYRINVDFTDYGNLDLANFGDVGGTGVNSRAMTKVSIILKRLDEGQNMSVLGRVLDTPPVGPVEDDTYIVAATGTGDWTGEEDSIARYNGAVWEFTPPTPGYAVWDEGANELIAFGTEWVPVGGNPFDQSLNAADTVKFGKIAIGTPNAGYTLDVLTGAAGSSREVTHSVATGAAKSNVVTTTPSATARILSQIVHGIGSTADVNYQGYLQFWTVPAAGALTLRAAISAAGTFSTVLDAEFNGLTVGLGSGSIVSNTAVGKSALLANTSGSLNTAIGDTALRYNTSGSYNTGVGQGALHSNTVGQQNVAVGRGALTDNTTGTHNTAVGDVALFVNTTGNYNVAVGDVALFVNTTGDFNTAVGLSANGTAVARSYNTSIGAYALNSNTAYDTCAALGYNAQVTGSNQVQLGGAGTTCYAYGAVVDRSDARDKFDVRDTLLGLDWVNSLRPVDYKLDMREDYRRPMPVFTMIDPIVSQEGAPLPPIVPESDASSEDTLEYEGAYLEYEVLYNAWAADASLAYSQMVAEHRRALDKWSEDSKFINLRADGTHARNRYHHGFIAQEMQELIEDTGVDFGGFKDAARDGGEDVLSLGYTEYVAPLVKSVQELSALNDEKDRTIASIVSRLEALEG